jgi:hypothetical protein
LAFLGVLFFGLIGHLPLSTLMTITNAPQSLSVPHVTARASQSFRKSLEVYCRSTGLLRTCTWYHGKRGACGAKSPRLSGYNQHTTPTLLKSWTQDTALDISNSLNMHGQTSQPNVLSA